MRTTRVWWRLLGVEHTVIESVGLEPDGRGGERLVARVRPKAAYRSRCLRCDRRAPGYDCSPAPGRWRGLDLGTTPVFLQASTRRVACPVHGVVVAAVPWARTGSRFTTAFEDTVAWLVCHATVAVVATLLRIAWRSTSTIVTRVVAGRAGQIDRLAGLRRFFDALGPDRAHALTHISADGAGRPRGRRWCPRPERRGRYQESTPYLGRQRVVAQEWVSL
ncbi:MAG: helix-turn-helix domain-containing protein [Pseudonocardiaceae bacterium]